MNPSTHLNRRLSRRSALVLPTAAIAGTWFRRASGLAAPIEPTNPDEPAVDFARYFAETGHNLKNPFLERWTQSGGESVLGVPISEERYDPDAGVVQTFATITLVYDPSLEAPWDVQAQHLPRDVVNQIAPVSARRAVSDCSSSASCRFFPEKGHTITGWIRSFWAEHGGLPIFGLPLSEAFEDRVSGVKVQVFERAVLEDHGSGDVRVRPMARILAEANGLFGDPAFYPAPPSGGTTKLVKSPEGLRLRAGPSLDDEIIVVLPDNAEFITAPGSKGDWIPGYADGYAGWVFADYLDEPPKLPTLSAADWNPAIWQGAALGETNVRAQPTTQSEIVDVLQYGDSLTVSAWVKGEEVFQGADEWAQIGPNRYVYARNVGRNAPVLPPPLPSNAPISDRWIDVHLTQQLMTAYEGRNPVRVAVTTTGMAGWETPPGSYAINTRVANETMDSGAIGAEHYYKLEDVLFTQYFTDRGHAIHFAWWRTPETIGRPGSHGCLNLLLDDARFFWDWADVGLPVFIRQV
jgi:hypothetical protein